MKLFSGDRRLKRSRGLERTREGEVIGLYALAAHVREVEEGGGEVAVLSGAGDEGSPGDDGGVGGE